MPATLFLPPTPSTANAGIVDGNGRFIVRVSGPCARLCDLIGSTAAGKAHGHGFLSLSLLVAMLASRCARRPRRARLASRRAALGFVSLC